MFSTELIEREKLAGPIIDGLRGSEVSQSPGVISFPKSVLALSLAVLDVCLVLDDQSSPEIPGCPH